MAEIPKFDISNTKKFKVINQDFYTKSLGNRSSPRNEDMIDMDSVRNKSLEDENEPRGPEEEALPAQMVDQPRGQTAPDQEVLAQDELDQLDVEHSIQFQNEDKTISAIDQVVDRSELE